MRGHAFVGVGRQRRVAKPFRRNDILKRVFAAFTPMTTSDQKETFASVENERKLPTEIATF
jgi:hypothetical protein